MVRATVGSGQVNGGAGRGGWEVHADKAGIRVLPTYHEHRGREGLRGVQGRK